MPAYIYTLPNFDYFGKKLINFSNLDRFAKSFKFNVDKEIWSKISNEVTMSVCHMIAIARPFQIVISVNAFSLS